MEQVQSNGGLSATESVTRHVTHLGKFVSTSTKDMALIKEFQDITAEYEKRALELKQSGIPQRRAEIILGLIHATTPHRTYDQVGQMLEPKITGTRVYQILRDARRREARRDAA